MSTSAELGRKRTGPGLTPWLSPPAPSMALKPRPFQVGTQRLLPSYQYAEKPAWIGPLEPWTDASTTTPDALICSSVGGVNVSALLMYFIISAPPQSCSAPGFNL